MTPKRSLPGILLAATLTASVASCSTSGSRTGTDDPVSQSSGFPVTIDSSIGSATINEQPERVVTIGWGSHDAALALGVQPVAIQELSNDTGPHTVSFPWNLTWLIFVVDESCNSVTWGVDSKPGEKSY